MTIDDFYLKTTKMVIKPWFSWYRKTGVARFHEKRYGLGAAVHENTVFVPERENAVSRFRVRENVLNAARENVGF